MAHQLQRKSLPGGKFTLPTAFIAICILTFFAGVLSTAYFCNSMCCDMEMPGGWTMSMMWMRMPDQTWLASVAGFLVMWLAMMVSMMMPSALPMFLKTQRNWVSLCYMAFGYFTVWLAVGIALYGIGVKLATFAMHSELLSRVVPLFLGLLLILAGIMQFTPWKMSQLLRCRSPLGCAISSLRDEKSFRLGCRQGAACCICCTVPMTIQLALGIMSPLVMIIVAMIITAEKLLPWPQITARIIGFATIVLGLASIFLIHIY